MPCIETCASLFDFFKSSPVVLIRPSCAVLELHLRDARLLSREALVKHLTVLAPRLTSFIVTGRSNLQPDDLLELLPLMKQLKELRLVFPRHVTFSKLSLRGLVKLQRLELRNCYFFGPTVLVDESSGPLEELRLVQIHGVVDFADLMAVVSRTSAGHLRILHLADSSHSVEDRVLEHISPVRYENCGRTLLDLTKTFATGTCRGLTRA
jgi:hypothetical protein